MPNILVRSRGALVLVDHFRRDEIDRGADFVAATPDDRQWLKETIVTLRQQLPT